MDCVFQGEGLDYLLDEVGCIVVSAELVEIRTHLHIDQSILFIQLELGDEGLNCMGSLLVLSQVT